MTIRVATPADAPAIADVHVASWRSSYAALLDAAYLTSLDVAERTAAWNRRLANPALHTVVALAGEAIVGFSCAGPNRDASASHVRGEVYAIYLREEAKGQGLGRALFAASLDWLRAHRMWPLRVWVFAENPRARAFYAAMGGVLTGEPKKIELAGRAYAEVAYDWLALPE